MAQGKEVTRCCNGGWPPSGPHTHTGAGAPHTKKTLNHLRHSSPPAPTCPLMPGSKSAWRPSAWTGPGCVPVDGAGPCWTFYSLRGSPLTKCLIVCIHNCTRETETKTLTTDFPTASCVIKVSHMKTRPLFLQS